MEENNLSPSKNSTLNRRSSMLITEVDKNLEYSDYSRELAILNRRVLILKYMKDINIKFSKEDYLNCINYDRLECLKIIFTPDEEYNNFLIERAVKVGNLEIVKHLFCDQKIELPKRSIYISLINSYDDLLLFILNNTNTFPVNELLITKLLTFNQTNLLINYELKSYINIKNPTKEELVTFIDGYMKIFSKVFIPHTELLKHVWSDISYIIIKTLLKYDRYFLTALLLIENKLDIYKIRGILDNLLFCENDKKLQLVWYIERKKLLITEKYELYNYVIDMSDQIFLDIFLGKKICNNSSQCNESINKKNLTLGEWNEVFLDNPKCTIFKTNDNYCFEISSLLKCWESDLNAYNYGITPFYPRNPYTRDLFDPLEIYTIAYYCSIYNIEIPFIVSFFLKNPMIVATSYKIFMKYKNNVYKGNTFLRNKLKASLQYLGEDSENNEGGKWELNLLLFNKSEAEYYLSNLLTEQLSSLLFSRISILMKDFNIKLNEVITI